MTAQEKWTATIRHMELVRSHYALIKGGGTYRGWNASARQRAKVLEQWLRAIEKAYRRLRVRQGKSPARARRDWLVARSIELTVFDGAGQERLRRTLTSTRPLHERYVNSLTEEAVKAVLKAAEEEGLLGG